MTVPQQRRDPEQVIGQLRRLLTQQSYISECKRIVFKTFECVNEDNSEMSENDALGKFFKIIIPTLRSKNSASIFLSNIGFVMTKIQKDENFRDMMKNVKIPWHESLRKQGNHRQFLIPLHAGGQIKVWPTQKERELDVFYVGCYCILPQISKDGIKGYEMLTEDFKIIFSAPEISEVEMPACDFARSYIFFLCRARSVTEFTVKVVTEGHHVSFPFVWFVIFPVVLETNYKFMLHIEEFVDVDQLFKSLYTGRCAICDQEFDYRNIKTLIFNSTIPKQSLSGSQISMQPIFVHQNSKRSSGGIPGARNPSGGAIASQQAQQILLQRQQYIQRQPKQPSIQASPQLTPSPLSPALTPTPTGTPLGMAQPSIQASAPVVNPQIIDTMYKQMLYFAQVLPEEPTLDFNNDNELWPPAEEVTEPPLDGGSDVYIEWAVNVFK